MTAGQTAGAIVDLLLRPARVFGAGSVEAPRSVFVLFILLVGAMATVDRLELTALGSTLRTEHVQIAESWPVFWTAIAVGALVGGPIAYFAGGFWYWMRLVWSGVPRPNARRARQVFLLSSLVVAVPTMGLQLLDTWNYDSPVDAWRHSAATMTLFVAPFWSVFVSYRGVSASFPVSRPRALLWFALLPALSYGCVLVFGVLLGANLIG